MDLNIDLLEKAALGAKYPSEVEEKTTETESFLTLASRQVKKTTIQVDPAKTRLWSGNPRNFALVVDISDLVPLIKKGKGNLTPVYARKLSVPDENGIEIEVIAGCRRRLSCIEAGELLTVDLVDVDDSEAKYLADNENNGRTEPDFLTDCRYLKFVYDNMKREDDSLTVTIFAEMQDKKVSRQTMNEKLKLAELPEWIQTPVQDTYTWGLRKGIKVKSILGDAALDTEALKAKLANKQFASADKLIAYITEFMGAVSQTEDKNFMVGKHKISLVQNAKGHTKISIPAGVPGDLLNEIEQVIKGYINK
ncbi:ParB N-terminal domain-containing protein [Thalassomonas actiniarum]|uniref:ParB N-terminal domain-containing protein n=1 Tax=Thalassomonas actiniarum TaxID=485447 RepID=A0AAE9Z026_9GAMM|nr:ParB N-terminal domain-containing protein [Thalassomonas actiniarum]WDE02708.1 ParB N-terminal domain-containing protein [Thalassomonas actiniarum]